MTDFRNAASSDEEGSAIADGPVNPNDIGAGTTGEPGTEPDYKNLYEELERKLGTQGSELGEYRSFFEGVAPLLDKLDKSPELVQAIINGQVDENIAKAAIEGRVTVGDAKIITQAHADVKKELGSKGYEKATPEEVTSLVEEQVSKLKEEFQSDMKRMEDERNFEKELNEFISKTPDFSNYAKEIEEWLDKHEEVTDVEVAYYAVKGQLSEKEAAKRAEEEKAEHAKNIALNAGGGLGGVNNIPEGTNVIDALVTGRSNPNIF